MNKHETKACPRCNADFECKTGSITLCQCQSIELSAEQLAFIAERYADCLCARCLAELRRECNLYHFEQRLHHLLRGHRYASARK